MRMYLRSLRTVVISAVMIASTPCWAIVMHNEGIGATPEEYIAHGASFVSGDRLVESRRR